MLSLNKAMQWRSLGLVIASAVCLLAVSQLPHASAAPREVNVAPFLQEVRVAGAEPTKKFTVSYTNDSQDSQTLLLSVVDFGSLDKTGGVVFAGRGLGKAFEKYSLSKWLALSANTIVVPAGQTMAVGAQINNDSTLSPGGHYAAIVATVAGSSSSDGKIVSLEQKLSSLVFAIKTGGEKYDLSLSNIHANSGLFHVPTSADLTFTAPGNVHVVPRGVISLKDGSKVISRGVINQESSLVLPGTIRIFSTNINKLVKPAWWHHTLTLQVEYRYDGYAQFSSKKITIQYFSPVYRIVAVLVLLLVVLSVRNRHKIPRKNSVK